MELVTNTTIPLSSRKWQICSDEVVKWFSVEFDKVPEHLRKSMTYDNGTEMTCHEAFTEKTGMKVYFADPGCPGQRGARKNTNGLIRDFFSKGTDFKKVSQAELKRVERLLNERPRKFLGFFTRSEVYRRLAGKSDPPPEYTPI